ncbi:c-type cytochrome [Citreimonas salinaria]|uniref:Cytochrome c n=1 Tax=Citreimonas salinaria TaxID=321339 RepID=A0A1H3NDZ2_9RHOB|nr:c-type cytochrome [Citreimonas salinaria]SDY87112.1 Cytochrome c [Citreimonas salinaria]
MMRALILLPLLLAGCDDDPSAAARALISANGCGTCHQIPEFDGADGVTGPPLTAMSRQVYVAGVVPNTLEALTAFIADPQAIDPRSAMPDLNLSQDEARLIAQYLYAVGEGS